MEKSADVTILLDRSGSMASIRETAVEGINKFIRKMRETPGKGRWSLFLFDDQDSARGAGEVFPLPVFEGVDDKINPFFKLKDFTPRGWTALRDALCMTIRRTKNRIVNSPDGLQPKVLFVIMTDGLENASLEFSTTQMRELLAEAQTKWNWEFIYLGANQDAFAVGESLGQKPCMNTGHTNKINYEATAGGVLYALSEASNSSRAWKAEGNESADDLISNSSPDVKN